MIDVAILLRAAIIALNLKPRFLMRGYLTPPTTGGLYVVAFSLTEFKLYRIPGFKYYDFLLTREVMILHCYKNDVHLQLS